MGSGTLAHARATPWHMGGPLPAPEWGRGRCHPMELPPYSRPPPASPHACLLGNGPASAPLCPQITAPAAASEAPGGGSGGTTATTPQPREGRGFGFGQQSGPPSQPLGMPHHAEPNSGRPGSPLSPFCPLCPRFVPIWHTQGPHPSTPKPCPRPRWSFPTNWPQNAAPDGGLATIQRRQRVVYQQITAQRPARRGLHPPGSLAPLGPPNRGDVQRDPQQALYEHWDLLGCLKAGVPTHTVCPSPSTPHPGGARGTPQGWFWGGSSAQGPHGWHGGEGWWRGARRRVAGALFDPR